MAWTGVLPGSQIPAASLAFKWTRWPTLSRLAWLRLCWHISGGSNRLSRQIHLTQSTCIISVGLYLSHLSFAVPCGWHALTSKLPNRSHPQPARRNFLSECRFRLELG